MRSSLVTSPVKPLSLPEILIRAIGPSCFPSAHLCDGIAIPTKLLYSSNHCPQLEHSLTFTLLSMIDGHTYIHTHTHIHTYIRTRLGQINSLKGSYLKRPKCKPLGNGRFKKFNFSKEKLPRHTLFINYYCVYLTYFSTFHFEAYRKLNRKLSGLYLQTNNNVFCIISNRNSNVMEIFIIKNY